MTAPTPEQLRALASYSVVGALDFKQHVKDMRAALRAAADQLEAAYWDRFHDGWNAALTADTAPQEDK